MFGRTEAGTGKAGEKERTNNQSRWKAMGSQDKGLHLEGAHKVEQADYGNGY